MKYIYNDKQYNSRTEAIKAYDPQLQKPILLAAPEVQDHGFDWSQEPSQSLDELYKNKATQLRDQYDYLILMYSGGSDSHQVFRTFLDNNIPLDVVITLCPLDMIDDAKKHPDLNCLQLILEHELAVLPRFKKYANPNIDFKVFDMSSFIKRNFNNDSLIADQGEALGWAQWFQTLRNIFQTKMVQIYIDKRGWEGKKVGLIKGCDKPLLTRRAVDNHLLVSFDEFGTYQSLVKTNKLYELNFNPIRFFWDDLSIVSKQAHIVKQALETDSNFNEEFVGLKVYDIRRDSSYFKKLIYPSTYEPNVFQQKIKNKEDDELFGYFFGNYGMGLIERLKAPNIQGYELRFNKIKFHTAHHDIGLIKKRGA